MTETTNPAICSHKEIGLALLPGFNFFPRLHKNNPNSATGYENIKFAK